MLLLPKPPDPATDRTDGQTEKRKGQEQHSPWWCKKKMADSGHVLVTGGLGFIGVATRPPPPETRHCSKSINNFSFAIHNHI